MSQPLHNFNNDLQHFVNPQRATLLQRYFKTGPGEYAEGDIFLGLAVPECRKLAVKYKNLQLQDIETLLSSKYHEQRLIALLLLVHNFGKSSPKIQEEIFNFYLSHTQYINNWDLVDLSAPKIVGEYLYAEHHAELALVSLKGRKILKHLACRQAGVQDDNTKLLNQLARSQNLWERRIAILATFAFINHQEPELALNIAEILINNKHDLIQKAVGWMLREVGKRCSQDIEEKFLKQHYKTMPRTMLRYAIERFPEEKRKEYLTGKI